MSRKAREPASMVGYLSALGVFGAGAGGAWAAVFSVVSAADALQHGYARLRTD
jgi:hypothetical protein